ncbi:uncharacterized protein EDB93DRAFT_1257093 [Suillus bovinus]|uniref:uncharacterized protein n=1 Tax=Suillus bovinus TaxID=48563 RepID=UPI001B87FF16|nr:uncharacterized protein EDB93DRAFT_1257093 [Suillus bovinus]KAG2127274.1 hypothetical protein EDB93DRAFT_1257093 [Suillus bovinus]
MPASHAALTQCICEECTRRGGYDEKGAPRGVLIAERSISAHIQCVKAESAASAITTVSSITDDIRHLSLAADNPQSPSFTSAMKNNLDGAGSCNLPAVPVSALLDGLERLQLSDCMSTPLMEKADRETVSKPKPNQHTAKALHILDNIDSWIQWCFRLLLHPCNLDDVGRELSLLCTAMENVNGGADFGSYQDMLQVPIEINTDTLQQAPVDHSDEISQVVLFLCSRTAIYPQHCMHCPVPGIECGDALLVGIEGELCPKRIFIYHDFKDYLSGLLSQRDVEAMMDEACDDFMDSINSSLPPFVKNLFEAQFLRQFGSPKPETLFIN